MESVNPTQTKRITYIKCCLCGIDFDPHEFQQKICKQCSQAESNIQDIIWVKKDTVELCKHCNRYERPPFSNIKREGAEMLGLMMKRVMGLQYVKVVEAKQLWTEEHSRRLKLMIVFRHEGVEDNKVFEFTEHASQCPECQKEYTPHKWVSCIQLRQKCQYSKTLAKLEYKMAKNKELMKQNTVVEKVTNGLDVQFKTQKDSQSFLNYVRTLCVYRLKQSKQLISADYKSNTQNYKYTSLVELPNLCKYDLVLLTSQMTTKLGGCSPLLLCFQIEQNVKLIDPVQNKVIMLTSGQYFQMEPDLQILTFVDNASQFQVVSHDDPLEYDYSKKVKGKANPNETKVTNQTSFSVNSTQKYINLQITSVTIQDNMGNLQEVNSHIGDKLRCSDVVYGYDVNNITQLEHLNLTNCPNVILVKKAKEKKQK